MANDDIILADSPLLYWPAHETSGTTLADLTGNGRTATLVGGPTLNDTPLLAEGGGSILFNGTSQYAYRAYNADLSVNPFSAECWMALQTTPSGYSNFMSKGSYGGNGWELYLAPGGNVDIQFGTDAHGYPFSLVPSVGAVHHYAVTYDGTIFSLWIDGVQYTHWNPGGYSPATHPFIIGMIESHDEGVHCNMSNIAYYDYALSPAQLKRHVFAGTHVLSDYDTLALIDGAAQHLALNETSGSTFTDLSGNGRDGTKQGNPTLGATGIIGPDDLALQLDGTGDYVSTSYQPFVTNSQRTFAGWANRDDNTAVDALVGSSAGFWLLECGPHSGLSGASNAYSVIFSPDWASTNSIWNNVLPEPGTWFHWALTWDDSSNEVELFINGVSCGAKTNTGSNTGSGANLRWGAWDTGFTIEFGGLIERNSVFERILTGDEIAALYDTVPGIATAPVNSVEPSVTGDPYVGEVLTTDDGTWDDDYTPYDYQWQRATSSMGIGTDISGATSSTYTTTTSDTGKYVLCKITATNDNGSTDAISNYIGPIIEAPVNTTIPTIAGDFEGLGVITATTGTFSGSSNTKTYQWQFSADGTTGWTDISGATSSSYTIDITYVDQYLRVIETATNAAGSDTGTSSAHFVAEGPPPSNTGLPSIGGSAFIGMVLSVTTGTWDGSPTSYAYQWKYLDADDVSHNISGATTNALVVTSDLVHLRIICQVIASNDNGDSDPVVTGQTDTIPIDDYTYNPNAVELRGYAGQSWKRIRTNPISLKW